VLFGSLVSGLGAYAFQVIGTRGLGEEAYAPISVLWTLQYLTVSVPLIAVEAYVTRLVARNAADPGFSLRRPLRVLSAWLAGLAAVLGVGTYLARDALFAGLGDLALVAAAIVGAFGAFVIIRGQMAGAERFRSYGGATALESLARALIALPALLLIGTTRSLAWILPVGPLLVVAWWVWDRRGGGVRHVAADADDVEADPGAAREVADVPTVPAELLDRPGRLAVRFLAITTAANGAAQTLLAAGPIVLIPLGASAAEVSVFFITVTAARVPLVFTLGGLLSRLLPPLTHQAQDGDEGSLRRATALLVLGTVAVAGIGAASAWWIGPETIGFFFGEAFTPDRLFTALTVLGVLLCTGALLVNQVLIARGSEQRLLLPWFGAMAIAVAVLLLVETGPTLRYTYGFVAGVTVALLGLVVAVLTAGPLPGGRPAPPVSHGSQRSR
jgi:O-antigen/teichoic acid export membrane protein